jgi:hypothetical protein
MSLNPFSDISPGKFNPLLVCLYCNLNSLPLFYNNIPYSYYHPKLYHISQLARIDL